MEMEDHDHHNQQFGIDLRQFIGGRPAAHFPAAIPQPPPAATAAELFSGHRNHHSHHHQQQQQQQQQLQPPQAHHHYDMMMQLIPRDGGLHDFRAAASSINACVAAAAAATPCGGVSNANHSASTTVAASSTPPTLSGLEAEAAGSFGGGGGGDGGTGRWPRQETLTLLEIRSRLDSKFKEANQKGPLWDEVSRIMTEEHGYQRSGKKCREKFENLYKYYKKTKEGKAGRQDGKHYRFFRQLEALYGETSNPISVPESHLVGNGLRLQSAGYTSTQANQEIFHSQKLCDSLSLSNSSEFDTSSSEDNDLSTATAVENDSTEKRRRRRGGSSWKAKIKDFIDSQMRKLMERQEAWLEKLTKTLEEKEQERMLREDAWRKQEAARMDKEHKFWEKKRAWIESRDAAIMEALRKLTGREVIVSSSEELVGAAETHHNQSEDQNDNGNDHTISNNVKFDNWPESEITRLIQLRTSMDSKFQRSGCLEEVLWEEIAAKMGSLGYDRSAMMCRDKWDCLNVSPRKTTETHSKKRKENSRNSYFQSNESIYNQGPAAYCEISEHGPETVVRTQSNDGSSPANSNAGNAVNDSCFRFLIGDGESLWENYGLKLNRDQNQ